MNSAHSSRYRRPTRRLAPGGHLRVGRGRRGGRVAGGRVGRGGDGLGGRDGDLSRLVRRGRRVAAADRAAGDLDPLQALGGDPFGAGGDQVLRVHHVPGGVGEDALLVVAGRADLEALDEHHPLDRAVADVDREGAVLQHPLRGDAEAAVAVERRERAVSDRRTGRRERAGGGGGGGAVSAADDEGDDEGEGKTCDHGESPSGGVGQPDG